MSQKLPKWLTRLDSGAFEVNPDIAYPIVLNALGVKREERDQYWLEVAMQCVKLKVQEIAEAGDDPRASGKPLVISIASCKDADGVSQWAHKAHPVGKGAAQASRGGDAKRDHYPKVRKALD